MIDSYFFIPGDKERFIAKMDVLLSDFFVIDLEDAVSKNNKQKAYNYVTKLKIKENVFVRVPFFDNCYTDEQKVTLIYHFEGRIVVPKLTTIADFEKILPFINNTLPTKIIILVENPSCFIYLKNILSEYNKYIYGVGFGSHDFCSIMGMKHELKNLMHYKKELLLLTKAFNKVYIDTVDINLKDLTVFKEECIFAFENGAEGKAIIHPIQLNTMKSIPYLSQIEIEKIKKVYNKIKHIDLNDIDVLEIEGEIYEMPHINRVKKLYEKLN
jgi:citrate lyase subunit beta/citryl-CoA lyase